MPITRLEMYLCKFINPCLESVKCQCLLSNIGLFWYLYKFSSFFVGAYCILILENFQSEMEVELAGSTVDHREVSVLSAVEIVSDLHVLRNLKYFKCLLSAVPQLSLVHCV